MLTFLWAYLACVNAVKLNAGSVQGGSVTFGTLFTPGYDDIPLDIAVTHLLYGSFGNLQSLAGVMVIVNGDLDKVKDFPEHVNTSLIKLSLERLSDRYFASRYFVNGPSTISDFSAEQQHGHYTLAMLSFLDSCATTFCVWADFDMLLHRQAHGQGWVDRMVQMLNDVPNASFVSMEGIVPGQKKSRCEPNDRIARLSHGVSSRFMLFDKARLAAAKVFPIELGCKSKECDTFENMLYRYGPKGLFVNCYPAGLWVLHPPLKTQVYFQKLRQCGSTRKGFMGLWHELEQLPDPDIDDLSEGNFGKLKLC